MTAEAAAVTTHHASVRLCCIVNSVTCPVDVEPR